MFGFVLASLLCAVEASVQFNDAFLGKWSPVDKSTPHAIIGPSGLLRNFAMSYDKKHNEYWMSGIIGQVFRINADKGLMQYCFARAASSPFVVNSSTSNKIVFCYATGKRMHSHKMTSSGTKATGCDAAQIVVELHGDVNANPKLELTFYMSPPIKHAWVMFERTGNAPAIAKYKVDNIFGSCDPLNPPTPTLASSSVDSMNAFSLMCPSLAKKHASEKNEMPVLASSGSDDGLNNRCRQLGTFLQGVISKETVDIRLQYDKPLIRCWPCNMSYSVSAKIPEDQYIAVAFKGMGYRFYEGMFSSDPPKGPERPNYFGMGTDPVDIDRTGTVMVVAYPSATGGCVRQMKAQQYVGPVIDVQGNPNIMANPTVERKNGRTIVRFTVEQHVGKNTLQIDAFFGAEQQAARVMWAIGGVREPTPTPAPTPTPMPAPTPTPAPTPAPANQYVCKVCAHIYDPVADGDGMDFEDLPDSWVCPVCAQPKSVYEPVGSTLAVEGNCGEVLAMHLQGRRGVSPLQWFEQHPNCVFDAEEFGHIDQALI